MFAARRAWTGAVLVAPLALNLGAKAGQYDPVPMNGADVTAHDVAVTLFKTKAGEPVDYSNHKLMYLDLSGLDFKGARLAHADLHGTDFQKKTWRALAEIPYGETVSYADQAARLGDAKKARAVGAANGRNPVSIVLPCHRVVGADGSLTGFAGGLEAKRFLLEHEADTVRMLRC